jgi:hypothetical protein
MKDNLFPGFLWLSYSHDKHNGQVSYGKETKEKEKSYDYWFYCLIYIYLITMCVKVNETLYLFLKLNLHCHVELKLCFMLFLQNIVKSYINRHFMCRRLLQTD